MQERVLLGYLPQACKTLRRFEHLRDYEGATTSNASWQSCRESYDMTTLTFCSAPWRNIITFEGMATSRMEAKNAGSGMEREAGLISMFYDAECFVYSVIQ